MAKLKPEKLMILFEELAEKDDDDHLRIIGHNVTSPNPCIPTIILSKFIIVNIELNPLCS